MVDIHTFNQKREQCLCKNVPATFAKIGVTSGTAKNWGPHKELLSWAPPPPPPKLLAQISLNQGFQIFKPVTPEIAFHGQWTLNTMPPFFCFNFQIPETVYILSLFQHVFFKTNSFISHSTHFIDNLPVTVTHTSLLSFDFFLFKKSI